MSSGLLGVYDRQQGKNQGAALDWDKATGFLKTMYFLGFVFKSMNINIPLTGLRLRSALGSKSYQGLTG